MKFKIPYYITNNGDGSASLQLCRTLEEAAERDDEQSENGEGWGESSTGFIELELKDNKLYYKCWDREYTEEVLIELEPQE